MQCTSSLSIAEGSMKAREIRLSCDAERMPFVALLETVFELHKDPNVKLWFRGSREPTRGGRFVRRYTGSLCAMARSTSALGERTSPRWWSSSTGEPRLAISDVRGALMRLDVQASTLFPDLDHLASESRDAQSGMTLKRMEHQ